MEELLSVGNHEDDFKKVLIEDEEELEYFYKLWEEDRL
jgi:hypothetical protein